MSQSRTQQQESSLYVTHTYTLSYVCTSIYVRKQQINFFKWQHLPLGYVIKEHILSCSFKEMIDIKTKTIIKCQLANKQSQI